MDSVELVDCSNLEPGSRVDVETKSRHYYIECLGGTAIRISGHPEYCPAPVPASLEGSLDGEGAIGLGMIGRGMRLKFMVNGSHPVTTSKIVHVHVVHPSGIIH